MALQLSKEYGNISLLVCAYLTLDMEAAVKEIISTITSKGQVTIPVEVRRHLRLREKDKVTFILEEGGAVRLVPPHYPDIASLRGAAGSLKEPLSWQEVQEIAREDHLVSEDGEES